MQGTYKCRFIQLNKNTNRIDRMSSATTNAFRRVFFSNFRSFLCHFSVMKIALMCHLSLCLSIQNFWHCLIYPQARGPSKVINNTTNCNRRYIVKLTGIYESFVAMTDGTYYKSEWMSASTYYGQLMFLNLTPSNSLAFNAEMANLVKSAF